MVVADTEKSINSAMQTVFIELYGIFSLKEVQTSANCLKKQQPCSHTLTASTTQDTKMTLQPHLEAAPNSPYRPVQSLKLQGAAETEKSPRVVLNIV